MDWQGLGALVGGVAAAFGGVRQFSGKAVRLRARIDHDLELLGRLRNESAARVELEKHIDRSVRALVALEQDQDSRRTDPYGLIWMVIFLGLAIGASAAAVRTDYDWWVDLGLWMVAALFFLLTLIGATVTFRQRPKDADGTTE